MGEGVEEIWIPLVDEPIGEIVQQLEQENPDIRRLVDTPQRLLAFRTFAYIRVGVVLGQLLVEQDVDPYDGSGTWVERLMREPRHRERILREIRAVANEIAADPAHGGDEPLGPDEDARRRAAGEGAGGRARARSGGAAPPAAEARGRSPPRRAPSSSRAGSRIR